MLIPLATEDAIRASYFVVRNIDSTPTHSYKKKRDLNTVVIYSESITSHNDSFSLEFRGNYSATSINMKLVHGAVIFGSLQGGGYWAGPQPAQSPPRCTKCNSSLINGQRIPLTHSLLRLTS